MCNLILVKVDNMRLWSNVTVSTTKGNISCEGKYNIPASSATIAFPTGWVAPVTTQTKPYCDQQSECFHVSRPHTRMIWLR